MDHDGLSALLRAWQWTVMHLGIRTCMRLEMRLAAVRSSVSRGRCQRLTFRFPNGESDRAFTLLASPRTRFACVGLFVAEPSCGAGCQRRSKRGLRLTVRACPLASTAVG